MKKFFTIAFTLLMSVSMVFASRGSAVDLPDIFEANQIGFGYDGGELDTSLYADFGTEKLRFTASILDLGGSFFNNTSTAEGSSMPVLKGIPQFFVGVGYNFGANKVALGYGLAKTWQPETDGNPGWMGNDISVAYQGDFGSTTIKFFTPIQFGMGTGKLADGYKLKNIKAFAMAPQVRWYGTLGKLTEVRFAVPFGSSEAEDALADGKDIKSETIGADLRMYFKVIDAPVSLSLVPRVIYKTATKGNLLETKVMGDSQYNDLRYGNDYMPEELGDYVDYRFEMPWNLRFNMEVSLEGGNDLISVWLGPTLIFDIFGAPKMTFDYKYDGAGELLSYRERKEPIMGLGYELPIELTIKPLDTLHIIIGMVGTGDIFNGANVGVPLEASVDGSVIWFF